MLILIISIIILVTGIVFLYLSFKNQKDVLVFIGIALSVLGGIAAIICVTMVIMSHTYVEYQFQQDYMEYEILQEQIDSGNYNSTTITSDIISYNQKVTTNRTYYNSPWFGLYYYEGCEKLPLLEIKSQNNQLK